MQRPTMVHFTCQRCSMPVSLSESLLNMNEYTLAELSLPILPGVSEDPALLAGEHQTPGPADRTVLLASTSTSTSSVTSTATVLAGHSWRSECQSSSFTLLSEPPSASSHPVSHKIQMVRKLFDMLSVSTGVDHPMCSECCDSVIDGLQRELADIRHQLALYRQFVDSLADTNRSSAAATTATSAALGAGGGGGAGGGSLFTHTTQSSVTEAELQQLSEEESALLAELSALQLEERQLQQQLGDQQRQCDQLQQQEQRYWKQYGRYRRSLIVADDEYRSLCNQLEYTTRELEKLKMSNIFNATFHIWHRGHFGTINNFRLGRLPSDLVEWWEINAAWGQTALLLNALARKVQLTFSKYAVLPFGGHSVIKSLSDGKELPLYGDGGFKFIWNPKFDAAMVAFLECLQELQEKIEAGGSGFRLPYRMSKGRIEDSQSDTSYSIKIQFNSEEHWTKALKFMLTNFKWAIAWVCADSSNTPA